MAHDQRVARALWLLEALTAAPDHRLRTQTACQELSCTEDELDGYLALLATLADREGGGRVIAHRLGAFLVLEGDAGYIRPLRLTTSEGIALDHVLDSLSLAPDLSERLRQALQAPSNNSEAAQVVPNIITTRSFGDYYQQLSEAITDGVRCRISYKAQQDNSPRMRTIDPIAISPSADFTYLVAWNVEKQAERRYRMDRICSVELTDESVDRHPDSCQSVAESLASATYAATIECSRSNTTPASWLGVEGSEAAPDNGGRIRYTVRVATPSWLFDEVLASAGDMVIIEPTAWRRTFISYAHELLANEAISVDSDVK